MLREKLYRLTEIDGAMVKYMDNAVGAKTWNSVSDIVAPIVPKKGSSDHKIILIFLLYTPIFFWIGSPRAGAPAPHISGILDSRRPPTHSSGGVSTPDTFGSRFGFFKKNAVFQLFFAFLPINNIFSGL